MLILSDPFKNIRYKGSSILYSETRIRSRRFRPLKGTIHFDGTARGVSMIAVATPAPSCIQCLPISLLLWNLLKNNLISCDIIHARSLLGCSNIQQNCDLTSNGIKVSLSQGQIPLQGHLMQLKGPCHQTNISTTIFQ